MRGPSAALGVTLRSAVPVVVLIGTLPLSSWASLRLPTLLWTSAQYPTGSPPWYFIGSDLAEAFVSLVHLACVLSVSVLCAWLPGYSRFAWMVAWQVVLFDAGDALWGLVILARTQEVWDPHRATAAWTSVDQYLHDPLRVWMFWLAVVCAAPFLALHFRQMRQPDVEVEGQD